MAQEHLGERELARGQVDGLVPGVGLVRSQVEAQIAVTERRLSA
jgi:hypothetical protein